MACRVPGCNTKYWNKQNKLTLFKASFAEQLANWQKILRHEGVVNFSENDRVCIAHFEEKFIDRNRVIYKRGGIVSEEPRKVPLLSPTAVPTIFPPKKEQLNYAVVLDEKTLLKQREIFKRKILNDGTLPNKNKRWEQCTGQIDTVISKSVQCDQLVDAARLLEEHDYSICTTSDYGSYAPDRLCTSREYRVCSEVSENYKTLRPSIAPMPTRQFNRKILHDTTNV